MPPGLCFHTIIHRCGQTCTESVFSSTKFVKVIEKLIYLQLCRNSRRSPLGVGDASTLTALWMNVETRDSGSRPALVPVCADEALSRACAGGTVRVAFGSPAVRSGTVAKVTLAASLEVTAVCTPRMESAELCKYRRVAVVAAGGLRIGLV